MVDRHPDIGAQQIIGKRGTRVLPLEVKIFAGGRTLFPHDGLSSMSRRQASRTARDGQKSHTHAKDARHTQRRPAAPFPVHCARVEEHPQITLIKARETRSRR